MPYWLKKSKPKQGPRPPRPESRQRLRMSLQDWREDKDLMASSSKLMSSDMMRMMLDVLDGESPHHEVIAHDNMNLRVVHQARIEGYMLCLNNLMAFGELPSGFSDGLVSTFEKPEDMQQ